MRLCGVSSSKNLINKKQKNLLYILKFFGTKLDMVFDAEVMN